MGKNDRIFEKINHIYLIMFHWQKNCPMQKANGLQLKLSGASYSSLTSGMVLGYSCHPHSINNYEKALATTNKEEVRKKVKICNEGIIRKTLTNKLPRSIID